mmetsp:Transcript_17482/g.52416  ORF Transcript_17482/g.52416 Transcript_17482/m.52416 type:complete len:211 (+) Transcript_17482:1180-1812(+)
MTSSSSVSCCTRTMSPYARSYDSPTSAASSVPSSSRAFRTFTRADCHSSWRTSSTALRKAVADVEASRRGSMAHTYSSISLHSPMFQAPAAAMGAISLRTWGSTRNHSSRVRALSRSHSARAARQRRRPKAASTHTADPVGAARAFFSYASSASSHRCSFSYHPSLSSMARFFWATVSTPMAASGWRSWLLMEMRASTAVSGYDMNSCSL